jgi:hypothetical protein
MILLKFFQITLKNNHSFKKLTRIAIYFLTHPDISFSLFRQIGMVFSEYFPHYK